MKKLLLALSLLLPLSKARAESIGSLFDAVTANPHFTILEKVTPIYFHDMVDLNSQGGFMSGFYSVGNGLFTTDAGWVTGIDHSTKDGALLGGSIHAPELLAIFFPNQVAYLKTSLPVSVVNFGNALNIGYSFKHGFDKDVFTHGWYAGLDYKFS